MTNVFGSFFRAIRKMKRRKISRTDDLDPNSVRKLPATKVFSDNLSDKFLFFISLTVRLSSVMVVQSFFVPDEYWQSTEVAHRHTFGYGYLTWEWIEKVRSYLYPFIFEVYFLFLKSVGVDCGHLVALGPHVIQSVLTAFADVSVYHIALKHFNDYEVASSSFALHLCSWFVYYTGSRTLSNTAEMCFTCIALSFFKFQNDDSKQTRSQRRNNLFFVLLFAGISCVIRPTSLSIWVPFLLANMILVEGFFVKLVKAGCKGIPILAFILFGIDYYFYNELVFVYWNFFQFNVLSNMSGFYGSSPFHWYVTQGLPVVMAFHLVFIFVGIYCSRGNYLLFYIGILHIIILSFIEHKEFRFLLPVVPFFMVYAGFGLKHLAWKLKVSRKMLIVIMLVLNVVPAAYFSLFHQRGVMDAVTYIRQQVASIADISVYFLMPCHSTPYYSYIHENISMRFLTCHPSSVPGYVDEADMFYQDPETWLMRNLAGTSLRVTHLVAFDVLPLSAKEMLRGLGYQKIATFFHSHFPEGRIGGSVDFYSKHF